LIRENGLKMKDADVAGVSLSWVPAGSLHHVGFVVASIAEAAPQFAAMLDCDWDGKIILDTLQAARVSFLRSKAAADPLFELVEPVGNDSPVGKFLARGGGLHHLCYQVERLEEQLRRSREKGALIARQPAPAAAFGGRRIAWVFTRTKLLIEYLEA